MNPLALSIRSLFRRPGFLATVVVTLALGLGAATAVFSIIDGVLLEPLPFPRSDRLVLLNEVQDDLQISVSYPNFVDWRKQNSSFQSMAAFQSWDSNVMVGEEPERVVGYRVTSSFFETVGVEPLIGRTFAGGRDNPGADPVAVIGHELWQRLFGGREDALEETVEVDGARFTVIGVMPPGYEFYRGGELWIPFGFQPSWSDLQQRDAHIGTYGVARLRPGTTIERAREDLATIADRLAQAYPGTNADIGAEINSVREDLVGEVRKPLLLLFGAVAFVLLITFSNVTNLVAVRSLNRQGEVAVRFALGSRRRLLMRQFLVENLLLTGLGAVLGIALAKGAIHLLKSYDPGDIPRLTQVSIDFSVMAFAVTAALLIGLFLSVIPVLQSWSPTLHTELRDTSSRSLGSAAFRRLQEVLVVSQVALSLLLLVGASLTISSFARLTSADPGIDSGDVLTFGLALPPARYPERYQSRDFYDALADGLQRLPGVTAAGVINPLPFSGRDRGTHVEVEFKTGSDEDDLVHVFWAPVTPDYFDTLGIPLLQGRKFERRDMEAEDPTVAIVDETMAERFWPDENPIGKRVRPGGVDSDEPWYEVVGVVGHVKHYGFGEDAGIQLYFPWSRSPLKSSTVVVRAEGDPMTLVPQARRVVASLDPRLPIFDVRSMDDIVAESVAQPRFSSFVLVVFATVAVILSVIGIYGVVAYTVSRRTREIGLRMALGASGREIRRLVLTRAVIPVVVGVLVGIGASLALSNVLESMVTDVSASDPILLTVVAITLLVGGVLGSMLPAGRAARVPPVEALRYD